MARRDSEYDCHEPRSEPLNSQILSATISQKNTTETRLNSRKRVSDVPCICCGLALRRPCKVLLSPTSSGNQQILETRNMFRSSPDINGDPWLLDTCGHLTNSDRGRAKLFYDHTSHLPQQPSSTGRTYCPRTEACCCSLFLPQSGAPFGPVAVFGCHELVFLTRK